MRFSQTGKPSAAEIHTLQEEMSTDMMPVPHPLLFLPDLLFWKQVLHSTVRPGLGDVADTMCERLEFSLAGCTMATKMALDEVTPNTEMILKWYNEATVALAFSRMWRELAAESPTFIPGLDNDGIFFDLHPEHLPHTGLHMRDTVLERLYDIKRPDEDQEVWLAGEEMYLCALSPADPSQELQTDYYEDYGALMPLQDFTSVKSYLKTTVWPLA